MNLKSILGEYYDKNPEFNHSILQEHYSKEVAQELEEYGDIAKTLEESHEQYLKEIKDIQILGEAGTGNYIGIFTQKDPKESILSLKKSVDLGTAFKSVGAKIDRPIKYDRFDKHFKQFILLDEKGNIYGGYRFSNLEDALKKQENTKNNENGEEIKFNQTNTPMGEYFHFNSQRLEENKESTIELGTAYVNQELANRYTMSDNIKALGMMINKYNNKKYLGKMTIPTKELYNENAADFSIYYLEKFFKEQKKNLIPKDNYIYTIDEQKKETFDNLIKDGEYQLSGNWKKDEKEIRKLFTRNKDIFGSTKRFPGMFGTYLGMSPEFTYHGSIKNPDGTVEAGITIDTDTINDDFRDKYIETTKETIKKFQDPQNPNQQITLGKHLEQQEKKAEQN